MKTATERFLLHQRCIAAKKKAFAFLGRDKRPRQLAPALGLPYDKRFVRDFARFLSSDAADTWILAAIESAHL